MTEPGQLIGRKWRSIVVIAAGFVAVLTLASYSRESKTSGTVGNYIVASGDNSLTADDIIDLAKKDKNTLMNAEEQVTPTVSQLMKTDEQYENEIDENNGDRNNAEHTNDDRISPRTDEEGQRSGTAYSENGELPDENGVGDGGQNTENDPGIEEGQRSIIDFPKKEPDSSPQHNGGDDLLSEAKELAQLRVAADSPIADRNIEAPDRIFEPADHLDGQNARLVSECGDYVEERPWKIVEALAQPAAPIPWFFEQLIGFNMQLEDFFQDEATKFLGDPMFPSEGLAAQILKLYFPVKFPKEKTYVCTIPKNGQTQVLDHFCKHVLKISDVHVEDKNGFINVYQTCWDSYRDRSKYSELRRIPITADWNKLVIVRSPIASNFDCFVRALPGVVSAIAKEPSTELNNMVNHYYPQMWFCGFSLFHERQFTVVHMDEDPNVFQTKIQGAFRSFGFNNTSTLFEARPYHATKSTAKSVELYKFLKGKPDLIDIIYKTYRIDYDYFNFALPDWALEHCVETAEWEYCKHRSRE